jgi:hypothetical protein
MNLDVLKSAPRLVCGVKPPAYGECPFDDGHSGQASKVTDVFVGLAKCYSQTLPSDRELGPGEELVRVLCPNPPELHEAWVAAQQPQEQVKAKGKKPRAKSSSSSLPSSIFEALHAATATLQAGGLLIPPGSRWADYTRCVESFQPGPVRPSRRVKKPVTVRPQRTLRTLQFQTQRRHGHGKRSHQPAVSLTIEFEQEIQGPLALGYGSHFGLGLFVPAD